jgi:hypothetical protein
MLLIKDWTEVVKNYRQHFLPASGHWQIDSLKL